MGKLGGIMRTEIGNSIFLKAGDGSPRLFDEIISFLGEWKCQAAFLILSKFILFTYYFIFYADFQNILKEFGE